MEEIRQILAGLDWSPLFISIKTGIAATIVSFFLGIWAARKVLKAKTGLRAVLDGILTLPLVLPPTVAGFFLLLIFSTRRTVGSYLYTTFDIKIVQSWAGCVIAATVIAFPLMYRNARAAFEQVDVNLIYAAQTLGMPEWKIFWRVIMPAAGPGVASGTILAFARALAPNPQVLLLDEPFAAIDAKVRGELRIWLKELVEKLGITSIFVTHDQDEAVEVADEIIIANHGRIEQMGTPLEIYKSPDTPFVAQFIGHSTIVENYDRLKGFELVENAKRAVIRPEFIKISKSGNLNRYMSAAEEGIITDVVFRGNRVDVTVNINGIEVVGERSLEKDLVSVGETVHVLIYRLYIFDEHKTYLMENSEMQEQDVFYI